MNAQYTQQPDLSPESIDRVIAEARAARAAYVAESISALVRGVRHLFARAGRQMPESYSDANNTASA